MRNIIVKVADKLQPFYYILYITTTREAPLTINDDFSEEFPIPAKDGCISCYPDPQKDEINIIVNDEKILLKNPRLKIYNSFAELIYAKIVNSTKEIINVKELTSGLYFLQLSEGK